MKEPREEKNQIALIGAICVIVGLLALMVVMPFVVSIKDMTVEIDVALRSMGALFCGLVLLAILGVLTFGIFLIFEPFGPKG